MQLETEDGTVVRSPTPSDIEHALDTLDQHRNSFVILGLDEQTYIQALVMDDGLLLEFQEGAIENHYQAANSVTRQQVASVFQRYAVGDESWHEDFEWRPIEISNSNGSGCGASAVVLLGASLSFTWWIVRCVS